MTAPKRPLPSLRFVIMLGGGRQYRLIPATTPKGRVMQDLWAVPGDQIMHTNQLKARCKRNGWRYEIHGDDGDRRRRI